MKRFSGKCSADNTADDVTDDTTDEMTNDDTNDATVTRISNNLSCGLGHRPIVLNLLV